MDQVIWQNGEMKPYDQAKTHVMSHGLHYGSGVFEGIRAYELASGETAILALKEHVERMFRSAESIGMSIPYTQDQICEAAKRVVKANGAKSCYIRPLVYYGLPPSKVRVLPDPNTPIEAIISSYEMGNYLPDVALDVKVSDFIRVHPKSTDVEAKICGNYVNSLQALLAIKGTKYGETIMLDYEGFVAEGSSENIFVISNGEIHTPQRGTILNGITRNIIIALAQQFGYRVIERKIKLQELFAADEIFFTGTAVEVRAVRTINDVKIGTGEAGEITLKFKEAYKKICIGENEEFSNYLTKLVIDTSRK